LRFTEKAITNYFKIQILGEGRGGEGREEKGREKENKCS
jgi:hypothetical protein